MKKSIVLLLNVFVQPISQYETTIKYSIFGGLNMRPLVFYTDDFLTELT